MHAPGLPEKCSRNRPCDAQQREFEAERSLKGSFRSPEDLRQKLYRLERKRDFSTPDLSAEPRVRSR